MIRVVMVCTGNICRSPIAEAILRDEWRKLGRTDLVVTSMGIHGLDNSPASRHGVAVCADHGIDNSAHRSRSLEPQELVDADIIFTMDIAQKEFIQLFFPRVRDKIFLLGSYPERDSRKGIVKDPVGGSYRMYAKTWDVIHGHIQRIIPVLLEQGGSPA